VLCTIRYLSHHSFEKAMTQQDGRAHKQEGAGGEISSSLDCPVSPDVTDSSIETDTAESTDDRRGDSSTVPPRVILPTSEQMIEAPSPAEKDSLHQWQQRLVLPPLYYSTTEELRGYGGPKLQPKQPTANFNSPRSIEENEQLTTIYINQLQLVEKP